MAKSRKKKAKKLRAKTTLPPVKESSRQHGSKGTRSLSIPPSNHTKQHRKRSILKKPTATPAVKVNTIPPLEGASNNKVEKASPNATALVNSFSTLSISSNSQKNEKRPKKHFSIDTANGKNGARNENPKRFRLEDVAKLIATGKARNIVIMAGAGISTGSGIPDFRTPGTGLYDNLQKYRIPSPTAIFDTEYFHYDPKPFFALAKELYPDGKYKPCLPHYFVRLLHEKGLLLRMYTQNIDGLERIAGIPPEKLVEAHGTFSTASCTRCGKKHNTHEIKNKVLNGIIPRCNSSGLCWGIVKPDIVFFGEDLPRRFYYYLKDFPSCDLLIIMGTSLEVEPFASLTTSVRSYTPRLLLNRDLVGPFKSKSQRRNFDVGVTGDLADTIDRFASLIGWKEDLDELVATAKLEEASEGKDVKSDSGSSDSGISSSESVVDKGRRKSDSLLPPDNNIKRYFHTIRSTPLPKSFSTHVKGDASYYDYIRDRTFCPAPPATKYNVTNDHPGSFGNAAHSIQYAQTVPGKKRVKTQSCNSAKSFAMRLQRPTRKQQETSSSDTSTDNESGSSESNLSSPTSEDSSS